MTAPIVNSHFPIMEHFPTIQGEGFYSGTPAFFIRIGGCNVGCHWCDVKESWPDQGHDSMSIEALVKLAEESGLDFVVITGGEPMMYNLDALTEALKKTGKSVHLETSGAYPLSGDWSWITFSPKKFKAPTDEFYNKAQELKVVIFNKSDFAFAEEHASKMHAECKLYLQPEWSKRDAMMPLIVEYIKQHPKWCVSLQTHKYMQIP
ncbi:MAG TPA: 7-carboxy-7-deazaguanine synthase QueE [Flavobacteriales bacterium]|nr:7-carboxy-7-deazaguanine synthase QueE [Flavobacteriales bacterium]